jgi:hypothetical protein
MKELNLDDKFKKLFICWLLRFAKKRKSNINLNDLLIKIINLPWSQCHLVSNLQSVAVGQLLFPIKSKSALVSCLRTSSEMPESRVKSSKQAGRQGDRHVMMILMLRALLHSGWWRKSQGNFCAAVVGTKLQGLCHLLNWVIFFLVVNAHKI